MLWLWLACTPQAPPPETTLRPAPGWLAVPTNEGLLVWGADPMPIGQALTVVDASGRHPAVIAGERCGAPWITAPGLVEQGAYLVLPVPLAEAPAWRGLARRERPLRLGELELRRPPLSAHFQDYHYPLDEDGEPLGGWVDPGQRVLLAWSAGGAVRQATLSGDGVQHHPPQVDPCLGRSPNADSPAGDRKER